jgi:hypothetical protein
MYTLQHIKHKAYGHMKLKVNPLRTTSGKKEKRLASQSVCLYNI